MELRAFPKEEQSVRALDLFFSFGLLLLMVFIQIQYFNAEKETPNLDLSVKDMSFVAILMLFVAIIFQIADEIKEELTDKESIISYISFGQRFTPTLILGAIIFSIVFLSLLTTNISIDIGMPKFAVTSNSVLQTYNILFVGIFIPFIEEKLFALTLFPTLTLTFNKILFAKKNSSNILISKIMALLLTSLAFGWFHLTAYNLNSSLMITAMVFRALTIILNEFTNYPIISITLHIANNLSKILRV